VARVAIVTGGASGLGAATAVAFAEAGMSVAVCDINHDGAALVANGLPGGSHSAHIMDVCDEAGVSATFTLVERALGPVAVFANFAGMIITEREKRPQITETSLEEWRRTFEVNALGAFVGVREMLRRRQASPVANGRIILIASSAAQIGGYNGPSPYIASKGAVLSFVKVAAREAAPIGVTVNAISPGTIDTPMLRSAMPPERDAAYCVNIPLGRIGRPRDIAAAAAFLASADAGYITGSCVDVNGGIRMQ
jgi:NAD(P)-dependent dehydrogenase (short-subunit alcohol dehydrogenase family)